MGAEIAVTLENKGMQLNCQFPQLKQQISKKLVLLSSTLP